MKKSTKREVLLFLVLLIICSITMENMSSPPNSKSLKFYLGWYAGNVIIPLIPTLIAVIITTFINSKKILKVMCIIQAMVLIGLLIMSPPLV